ncbi:MAG: ankyrin repeat domain-containing protein [Longimicrobiales bacterium]
MFVSRVSTVLRGGLSLALGALLIAAAPAESPVADAAERGDAEEVRSLLRQGADANAAQVDGMTGLHWAAVNNEVEIAQVLLYGGATLKATTRLGGYTALHLASKSGHAEVVHALLEAGSDPNVLTTTGAAPLHFAAEANSAGVIAALVEHGANVNVADAFAERTPLMFAAARNAGEAVKALLAGGADPAPITRIKDYEQLDSIARWEQQQRRRILEAAKDPEPQAQPDEAEENEGPQAEPEEEEEEEPEEEGEEDPDAEEAADTAGLRSLSYVQQVGKQGGFAALHYAAREGHLGSVRMLVEAGADVNQPTGGDQSTPLLVAIINGNYDVAADLLASGADPNLISDDGVGPLFATMNIEWSLRTWYPQPQAFRQQETDYLTLTEMLLEAGADPNERTTTHTWYASYNAGRMGVDFTGATPLWRAAYAGDVKAMRLLVDHGADHEIWTQRLPSRRFFITSNGQRFRRGGDEEEKDYSGLPEVAIGGPAVHPLHAAAGVGFGTSRVAQQYRGVPGGRLPTIKYLIEELGVDPNLRDMDGFNAIHHAAPRGDNELILYLVSKGTDVTALSRRGQTTADMANSPEQRAQPLPPTIALLEKLGSKNNHQCQSCGGATRRGR